MRGGALRLAPLTAALMRALCEGRRSDAERDLGASIPPQWTLPDEVLRLRIAQLEQDPARLPWLLHAVIRRSDSQLVGNAGFHGPPGAHPLEADFPGVVELGYGTAEPFRRLGYATEACAALLAWARTTPARHVALSIAPGNAASLRVAAKLGFGFVREYAHAARGVERLYVRAL